MSVDDKFNHIRKLVKWYKENGSPPSGKTSNEILNFSTEAETVCFLVVPLLILCGFDEKRIMLEFSMRKKEDGKATRKRIDILILADLLRKQPQILIEVKKFADNDEINLKKKRVQAFDYFNLIKENVQEKQFEPPIDTLKTIILTDGNHYLIYQDSNFGSTKPYAEFKLEDDDCSFKLVKSLLNQIET